MNFEAFEDDWRGVIKKAQEAGVKKMIVVGTDLESSEKAIKIAEEVDGVFATVGYHPHHARGLSKVTEEIKDSLKKLARSKKVTAIGECGLDYHVYKNTKYEIKNTGAEWEKLKIKQKQLFGMQIQLALELKLPMVIHNREADMDVLDTMDHFCKIDNEYPEGVFHCVSGSREYLKKILEMGFYVGVDGNVTYDEKVEKLVREISLEKLLIETDSPYLMPNPLRKEKMNRGERLRNEPISVRIIAEYLAKLKKVSLEKLKTSTTKNAEVLFNI